MKIIIPDEIIERKIFIVHGQKVMLDKDLAELYGVQTKVLNQAVKRNIDRFPQDFMFSLTRGQILRMSQIVTSLKFSKNINVFTEQGVAMLSSVLRSKKAIHVNIAIMRAFVKLRKILYAHKGLMHKLEKLERRIGKHDEAIKNIFEAIRRLMEPPKSKEKVIEGFCALKAGF